jgi:hypothetical protein
MDLAAARSSDPAAVERERRRFMRALQPLLDADGPKLLVTDSQVTLMWWGYQGVLLVGADGAACDCRALLVLLASADDKQAVIRHSLMVAHAAYV